MLARRFVVYLLLPLLLMLVAAEATVYSVTRRHLQEQIDGSMEASILAIDDAVSNRFETIRSDLAVMLSYQELARFCQQQSLGRHEAAHRELGELEQNMVAVAALKPRCEAFHLFDRDGVALISVVGGSRNYKRQDVSSQPWFQAAVRRRGGESAVSDVYVSSRGHPTITVSAPVAFDDRLGGVLAIDIRAIDLTSDLIAEREPLDGYVFVVGPTGRVLDRTSSAPAADDVSGTITHDRIRAGYAGMMSVTDPNGEMVQEAYRPQADTDLGIVVGVPHRVIFAPIHNMRNTVVPVTIIGFLVIAIVGLVMVRRTVRPIHDLTRAAGRIARGDLDRTIEIRTGDEIEALAESFNHMTASLVEALARARASAEVEERRATELSHAYEELQDAQTQLVQVEKMGALGQLAGGIAHDFNNLLSGIMSSADLLKRRELDDAKRERYLDSILDTSRRAAELIRQLLAFSRAGSKQSVRVDVNTLAREVGGILRRTVDPRIEIVEKLEAEESAVAGDPSQLQSALLNLGVNARDAMPDGGVLTIASRDVTLDANYCEQLTEPIEPGHYVELSVSDTGTGMDPDVASRIFEPFFTTKEVGAGTGLGLSAVHGTIRSHDGSISVYSELGHGSVFRIYLPRSSGEVAEWEKPQPASVVYGSGCVLLVDDEPLVRSLGQDMLEWLGYEVLAAADGEAALECYRRERARIDIVVADLVMPRMNGRDLLRELRAIDSDVCVLIASGFLPNVEIDDLLAEGASDFLHKPYMAVELSRRVASSLASRAVAGAHATEDAQATLRVMIVDDTKINREAVGGLVEALGHTAVRVGDAKDALARLETEAVDVVLMDVEMPELDGRAATRLLREREATTGNRVPVVAMTGHTSDEDREACLAAGMDDFLSKPIESENLRAALARVVAVFPTGGDAPRTSPIGDDEMRRVLAEAFLTETPDLLRRLHVAIADGDTEEVHRIAHNLKSSVGYFDAQPALRHATELEACGRAGVMNGAAEIARALEVECGELLRTAERMLDGPDD